MELEVLVGSYLLQLTLHVLPITIVALPSSQNHNFADLGHSNRQNALYTG